MTIFTIGFREKERATGRDAKGVDLNIGGADYGSVMVWCVVCAVDYGRAGINR